MKYPLMNHLSESLSTCILTISLAKEISGDQWPRGGGGLPNKGRDRCAASAKPRPGKISQKNLMPGQS